MSVQPTLGEALRQARQARSLTLEQAAELVHIKPHYLQALEEGRWEVFASPVQGRGFLRLYAGFLGVDLSAWDVQAVAPDALDKEAPSDAASTASPEQGEPAPTEAEDPGAAYFRALGRTLREQRERLGLSLEQCEVHTHVRRRYLEALEEGRVDDLPSPVQGRGMLQHYARFLQLDPDPLLLQFADGLRARLNARRQAETASRRVPRWVPRPRVQLPERGLALGAAFLMVVFVAWTVWQVVRLRSAAQPLPTPPSVLELLHASPTPTLLPTAAATGEVAAAAAPLTPQVTPTPTLEPIGNAPVQVFLIVRQRVYLRVWVDGEERLAERVLPGTSFTFGGNARVEVAVANGAAVQAFFNQRDLGLLGRQGEAVVRVFTVEGVQTPTPTPTPPVTPTPTPTLTPTPTATPTPQPALP